ncbi:MAG: class GN sortase [Xanthobacteraceae bacterium]|nr:class GN sortase [Xanthobacteraceae bacterium]
MDLKRTHWLLRPWAPASAGANGESSAGLTPFVPAEAATQHKKWFQRIRLAFVSILTLAGLVLLGQGAYIHAKALLAQVLLERAFAETIATGREVKPWSWADTWPVARIEVKRLGASAIALAGSSGQALAFGPGHVELTPDAGERGVAVYSAHRDTHFRFLKDVAISDEIAVTRRDGRTFRYRVSGTSVVNFDQSGIDPLAEGHRLVLATCWPLDAATPGPMRYLVHADMIEETAGLQPDR